MQAINNEIAYLRNLLVQERAKWNEASRRLKATLAMPEMLVISQECNAHELEVERLEELLRTAEKTARAMEKQAMVQNGSLAAGQGVSHYYSPYQDNAHMNPVLASQIFAQATEAGAFGNGATQIFTDAFDSAMNNNDSYPQNSANLGSGYVSSSYSTSSEFMPYTEHADLSESNSYTNPSSSSQANSSGSSGYSTYVGSNGGSSANSNSGFGTFPTSAFTASQSYDSDNATNYPSQQADNIVYPFGSLQGYSVSDSQSQQSNRINPTQVSAPLNYNDPSPSRNQFASPTASSSGPRIGQRVKWRHTGELGTILTIRRCAGIMCIRVKWDNGRSGEGDVNSFILL